MSTPESPAALLRRAAALMRKRAAAADPGPWTISTWEGIGGTYASVMVPLGPSAPDATTGLTAMAKLGTQDAETAEHIASWDPPMALTVADLLDRAAKEAAECLSLDRPEGDPEWFCGTCDGMLALDCHLDPALAVARAFLGGPAPEPEARSG